MVIKKWKIGLLALVLFAACKSADCGCPMAEDSDAKSKVVKSARNFGAITSG